MNFSMLAFIILITGLSCISASKQPSLMKRDEQLYPHIVQYIQQFSLSANDLQRLLNNQYTRIFIADIMTADYEVHQRAISLSYDGSSRLVEEISPLKVKVTNDSFSLKAQFQVTAIHRVGTKNYTCSTKIPQIKVGYTKTVDFDSGNTVISAFISSFSSNSFEEASCGTVPKNDSAAVMNAVNSTKGGSLYLQLKTIFDRMQEYLSANAKDQRLSQVYDQNPYVYDFYGFKMNVQVNTIEANPYLDNGIENYISGIIAGSSFPALQPPQHEQGFTTFYSYQFIQGVIEYAANNYGSWREIKLSRNNMRTSFFKWRVLDFQYIIPAVLARHPQSYLSDVQIMCGLQEVTGTELEEKQLKVGINWQCSGSFEGEDKRKVTFLSFMVGLTHSVQFTLREENLNVRVAKVQMVSLQFDYIGQYEVIDPFTAGQFIKQGLFQFQTYTFGTFFKVRSKQLKLKVVPNRGLWIA